MANSADPDQLICSTLFAKTGHVMFSMRRVNMKTDHFSSVGPCIRPLTFSNDFSSEAAKPILLKFHMEPP